MNDAKGSGPTPDELTDWITTAYPKTVVAEAMGATLFSLLPHPVYAKQRWICILNPSRQTFDAVVKPLIAEAHARLAR